MFYIYRITNLIDGKTYIGQHEYEDLNDNYMGSGKLLKKAQKKYGMENFKKDILVFNISKLEHANLLEETFIAAEREKVGRKNCYNISDGGKGCSLKGREISEETRRKMSDAHKNKPTWNKGKHLSEEQKRNLSEAHKGKPAWNKGKLGYNKGRKLSEETRRKMSEARKDRKFSDEWKKKISEAKKGKHWKLVDGKRVWY